MKHFRRVWAALGALLFGGFAALQLNDPDALEWLAVYGLASALCLVVAFGRRAGWWAWLLPGVALVWALSLLPVILAQPVSWPEVFGPGGMAMAAGVEEMREALGLSIVLGWTLALLVSERRAAESS